MLSIKQLESATKADKSKFLHTSALWETLLQIFRWFQGKVAGSTKMAEKVADKMTLTFDQNLLSQNLSGQN